MSRGPYSMLLMLAMSLPGAARALGLGDIRVDSALNEPLSAQIDIVGASRDELMALTASVANREIFQRYGADRPAFLSSATFKVGMDAQGRPVLNIRSGEAFTDPLVSLLVDLRWGKTEIIREYSLLLDPPGLAASTHAAAVQVASAPADAAAPAAAVARLDSPAVADRPRKIDTEPVAPAPIDASAGPSLHKVVAGDTLRGIARHAGARSESHVQRAMIAIFRANPGAFDGNINRMHEGAVLSIPAAAAIESISGADAKREVRAHMTAWRLDGRPGAARRVAASSNVTAAPAAVPVAATPAAPAAAPIAAATLAPAVAAAPAAGASLAASAPTARPATGPAAGAEPADAQLNARVQTLEKALDDMHNQLATESARIEDLKEEAARAAVPAAAAVQARAKPAPADASKPVLASVGPQTLGGKLLLGPLALTLGLLIAGVAYARRRLQNGHVQPAASTIEAFHADGPDAFRDDPAADAAVDVPAPSRVEPAASPLVELLNPAVPAAKQPADAPKSHWPAPAPAVADPDTTQSLEIDTELLERSYLESMGDETLDTVMVDTSELETAMAESELNTMVLEAGTLEGMAALEDTNKLASTHKIDTAGINQTELDYNLLDLDATAQHVQMPSDLHDRTPMAERRTNIVDVLKSAIDRDPYRRDLRMKLLESYYSAAATNQRAFLEVVRKLSREPDLLSAEDWKKVTMMGREIAGDDILFVEQPKDEELAHCA